MGIYPEVKQERLSIRGAHDLRTALRITTSEPGLSVTVVYEAVAIIEERTNCFCCTCDDGSNDPYCRNHGWYGTRPCDIHGMPGEADDEGHMPMPVGAVRESRS